MDLQHFLGFQVRFEASMCAIFLSCHHVAHIVRSLSLYGKSKVQIERQWLPPKSCQATTTAVASVGTNTSDPISNPPIECKASPKPSLSLCSTVQSCHSREGSFEGSKLGEYLSILCNVHNIMTTRLWWHHRNMCSHNKINSEDT